MSINLQHSLHDLAHGKLKLCIAEPSTLNIAEKCTAQKSSAQDNTVQAKHNWSADKLFGIASRQNPRRGFMFVSKVLGRHVPAKPSIMRAAIQDLAEKLPLELPGPIVVFGMAETAIGLSAGVHQHYTARRHNHYTNSTDTDNSSQPDVLFLCSSRHPTGEPLLTEFEEKHSHAHQHIIHAPNKQPLLNKLRNVETIIVVDDEISTGNTVKNLIKSLNAASVVPKHIIVASLLDFADNNDISLKSFSAEVQSFARISLLNGEWHWQTKEDASKPKLPEVAIVDTGKWQPKPAADWGRLGITKHKKPRDMEAKPSRKTLIIGTGEYVWPPFLLAEQLETAGERVDFVASTRSPIMPGGIIQSVLQFKDNYGLGINNYLYNCDPEHYDRVVICCETAAELVDPVLVNHFNAEIRTHSEIMNL